MGALCFPKPIEDDVPRYMTVHSSQTETSSLDPRKRSASRRDKRDRPKRSGNSHRGPHRPDKDRSHRRGSHRDSSYRDSGGMGSYRQSTTSSRGRRGYDDVSSTDAFKRRRDEPNRQSQQLKFQRTRELLDSYDKKGKLGRGSFGVVWRVRRKTDGMVFACKEISKKHCSEIDLELINLECEMMHICRKCPNICTLIEVFISRDYVSMVMEEMRGGELFDYLVSSGKFTERDCARHMRCIFDAIAYMHDKGVIHRDLKPENLCYADKKCTKLKVIDLGLSCYIDEAPPDACGTFEFLAPEQMEEVGYNEKVDVFALGIIVYVMMVGKSPFEVPNDELRAWDELPKWHEKMVNTRVNFKGTKITRLGRDFIGACLEYDPEDRISAQAAVRHPWLQSEHIESTSRQRILGTDDLRKYQIIQKIKRGVRTLVCLKRMERILKDNDSLYQKQLAAKKIVLKREKKKLKARVKNKRIISHSPSMQAGKQIAHLSLQDRINIVSERRASLQSKLSKDDESYYSAYEQQSYSQQGAPPKRTVLEYV